MEGDSDNPMSFVRIIMPSILRHHKMVLPKIFVEAWGDELSNFVKLNDPVGGIWRVGLEREGELIWLVDGWKRFMDHHSIRFGYMLMFEYRGRSEFDVNIFDLTCIEIAYSPPIEAEETVKEEAVSPSSKKFEIFHGTDKALREASMFKTYNPSFEMALKACHVGHSSLLSVPPKFSREYFPKFDEEINLQDSEGKKWPVRCIKDQGCYLRLSKGWKQFVRHNGLKEGDVCVFEVVQFSGTILKVSIFRRD